LRKAATAELPVVKLGVWQKAHPTELNTFLPLAIDGAPPGVSGDAPAAPAGRMKNANFSMALSASVVAAASVCVMLLG
jgi:hypothetical protein